MINSETKQFILDHEFDDLRQLALQASKYPNINLKKALDQIKGRQIAKNKIPSWYLCNDIVYPHHLSMEQCSSEKTAQYKASLCKGKILIDLTGGLGVDLYFMSKHFEKVIYIETKPELVELAKHNFGALNQKNIECIKDDAIQYLESYKKKADTIFIDPARRSNSGRKTVLIEDCTPNLLDIDEMLNSKANQVIIKLSPMLDITQATQHLSKIADIHILSVNNECKELLFVKRISAKEAQIHCINIRSNDQKETFTFTKKQEENTNITYTEHLQKYLYEPNSSVMKAGAYKSISSCFSVKKLHANSHLYTSDELIPLFPGRIFLIKDIFTGNKREINSHLKIIKQANISTRNYPFSVEEIRKQTKLQDGGSEYIFATTLANEKKILILCDKLQHTN